MECMPEKHDKMKVEAYGHITGGKLYISNRAEFNTAVSTLERDGRTPVKITIDEKYRKRSNQQNRYYWGVIVEILAGLIAESCGEKLSAKHREQAHEVLKLKCNPQWLTSDVTGETFDIPGSTTTLSTSESEVYFEACRQWIFEFFWVVVPLPNEQVALF